jgi:signal transduction histidine kinase
MVTPTPLEFSIADLFARLIAEFAPQAEAKALSFRCVTSRLTVRCDPRLLE